jgi:hypothetical protein
VAGVLIRGDDEMAEFKLMDHLRRQFALWQKEHENSTGMSVYVNGEQMLLVGFGSDFIKINDSFSTRIILLPIDRIKSIAFVEQKGVL